MVVANVRRSVGDIGKYIEMDLAHVFGAATATVGGALVSTGTFDSTAFDGRNTTGAAVAIVVGVGLLALAGGSSEEASDALAPMALGALLTSVPFLMDSQFSNGGDTGGGGGNGTTSNVLADNAACGNCFSETQRAPTPSDRRCETLAGEMSRWGAPQRKTQRAGNGQYAPTPSPRRDQIRNDYELDSWG